MAKQTPSHGFTIKSSGGLLNAIIMPVVFFPFNDRSKKIKVNGLWDTGANSTVINQNIVNDLGLILTGKTRVNTASQRNVITDTFLVDIFLKQDVSITGLNVTLGTLDPNIGCLLGMDIITLGDFSITNLNGNTCMSFRVPSQHEIDYVIDIDLMKKKRERKNLYKGRRGR